MGLVEFTSFTNWDDKIFVDPSQVMVIKRYHQDRDLGEYSSLIMRDGTIITVTGLPTAVAKKVRDGLEVEWMIAYFTGFLVGYLVGKGKIK